MSNSSDTICLVIQSEHGNGNPVSNNYGSQMDANQAQMIHESDREAIICNTGELTHTGDCDKNIFAKQSL